MQLIQAVAGCSAFYAFIWLWSKSPTLAIVMVLSILYFSNGAEPVSTD